MLFVGIDVAKSKHDCCIIDSDGVIITNYLRIPNSKEGFEALYDAIISALGANDISNAKIGLESTGHYSTNITNYLYSKGFSVVILNPLVTNAFRKASTLRKTKTDKCDAQIIATMLFSDESKSYSPSSYQIQELKSLTRHRYRMIGYRSKLKLSITRLIDITFPELPDFFWSIHQTSSYNLLLELPTPKDICTCHLTHLTNIISKSSRGKYGKEKAIALKGQSKAKLSNWDAIVGAKGRFTLDDAKRWFVPWYVDIGTGESSLTWQAMGGVGYAFSWGEIVGAWRYLDYDMKSGSRIESMNFNGPAIALAFRW
jgi:hypothetical protein